MKDATNGETPRGAVSTRRSVGIRMGKPTTWKMWYPAMGGKTQGTEISKYLQEKKVKTILLVATSERGGAKHYKSYKTID
jgi:hypothetical protein